ncbi:MAG TPA: SUMF1/EgtB/PvdO family nonheme iron enzyme, partial [Solirubrobacteraceae bacterium]|nr:SUMF1/EgtB/PvdO family nonheme iron enzyme [Solirubrobacteraceae bacterium]
MRTRTRAAPASGPVAQALADLREARQRTLALVDSVSDRDLVRVHSTLMSPLVWDLGHIPAFEDLWLVHRHGQRPMVRPDLVEVYDALETPRARRGDLPFLGPAQARAYQKEVRHQVLSVLDERGVGDGTVLELVTRHEQQHNETMLQTLELARLDGYRLPEDPAGSDAPGWELPELPGAARRARVETRLSGLEMVEVPEGPCLIGAPGEGFAYDNERPRHRTDVRGYLIGRAPITNATYLTFVEGGGYERREWWSDEGWSWKEQYDITRPLGWTHDCQAEWRVTGLKELDPHRPVVHVSWFEADAFARAQGGRLPTEEEWEKAATWDQQRDRAWSYPWGEEPPVPGVHANLDQLTGGPAPAGAFPDGC